MRRKLSLGWLLLALPLAGCAGGTGDITGAVRYKGAPLPSGRVTFVCEGGEKPVLSADIKEGTYAIPQVPGGPVKVSVETFQVKVTAVPNMPKDVQPPGGGPGAPAKPGKYVPIPPRYKDPQQSGLTFTVAGGSQKQDFDLVP